MDTVYCLNDARVMSPRQLIRHSARLAVIANYEAWLRHVENCKKQVREIIRARLPDARVWVYGSRDTVRGPRGAPAATPTWT